VRKFSIFFLDGRYAWRSFASHHLTYGRCAWRFVIMVIHVFRTVKRSVRQGSTATVRQVMRSKRPSSVASV